MTTDKEKTYFIGGINGVGKTTLLKEIGEKHSEFEVVRGSQCLMQWLGIKPGDYTSLRSLSDDFKDEEMSKMMQWLLAQRPGNNKHLLFDAHFLNIKEDSIVKATGDWIGLMDALLVVTASNDEVLRRIELDQLSSGRSRPIFKENAGTAQKLSLIDSYQEKTLEEARTLAQKYCLPLIEIKNNDGKIEEAINQFINFHRSI
jgi:adenylate kinase